LSNHRLEYHLEKVKNGMIAQQNAETKKRQAEIPAEASGGSGGSTTDGLDFTFFDEDPIQVVPSPLKTPNPRGGLPQGSTKEAALQVKEASIKYF
jgi:hypothetical protein